jgi:hypothetical protein
MEQEAATVEHDLVDAGRLRPLGDRLADLGSAALPRKSLSRVEAEATVRPAASSITCA